MSNIDWSKVKSSAQVEQERLNTAAEHIRNQRDKLIADTDFYMLPDAPEQPSGLLVYRQALRDITEQAGFPDSVEWPTL